jgi:8-oxo-dGTP pyrophosphatase MutT (NUDIX family)
MKPNAAGVMLMDPAKRVLFLKRAASSDEPGTWCFPGGGIEGDETPEQAARRECAEETGYDKFADDLRVVDEGEGDSPFVTHGSAVDNAFSPRLNDEHVAHAWAPLDAPPEPLHPGVRRTIDGILSGEGAAEDAALSEELVAFDRESVRRYDKDGHLHVAMNPISKSNVCEYLGREIPRYLSLGLEPTKLYKMLRDPEELAKGAPTFAGKPIMLVHKHIHAYDHPHEVVVGAVGTDVSYEEPYLKATLSIWDGGAILLIDGNKQKELSSSYRYSADMTPGVFKGEPYDGVIRDIVGNHVALVTEGRAGDDVVVGDSKENILMAKTLLSRKAALAQGALFVFLQPKLAQDSKLDLGKILEGVTSKNYAEKKKMIGDQIRQGAKLAADASLDDLTCMLDSLEKVEAVDEMAANSGVPLKEDDEPAEDEDVMAKIREILADKLSDEDYAKLAAALGGKPDATDAEPVTKPATKPDDKEDTVSKKEMETAMDSAVKKATDLATKRQRDIFEALEFVTPYVGKLSLAFDSAEDVYRTAIKTINVDLGDDAATLPASALRAVLGAHPKPGARKAEPAVAMDAKSVTTFNTRYPDAGRIGQR